MIKKILFLLILLFITINIYSLSIRTPLYIYNYTNQEIIIKIGYNFKLIDNPEYFSKKLKYENKVFKIKNLNPPYLKLSKSLKYNIENEKIIIFIPPESTSCIGYQRDYRDFKTINVYRDSTNISNIVLNNDTEEKSFLFTYFKSKRKGSMLYRGHLIQFYLYYIEIK